MVDMANTPKDVEKAVDRFMAGDDITWDEVIEIGTGVKYKEYVPTGETGDDHIIDVDDMTFGETMLSAEPPKITNEMMAELFAVRAT